MKFPKFMSLVLIAAVALSACSTAAQDTTPGPDETMPAMTSTVEVLASATPDANMGTQAAGTGTPSTDTDTTPAADGTGTPVVPVTGDDCTVQASDGGDHLVDCSGMTIYIYTADHPNSGESTCTDDCALSWPPLMVSDGQTPAAGDGADPSLLGTISRPDGTMQVTYNGWPLYLYSGDTVAGEQNGLGIVNWALISPAGEEIK
jgi:predicted lipoprotein with Yx(FWY)xxD motif